jgi:hypothetical protein
MTSMDRADIWVLLWTLILGFSVGQRRQLTVLWEVYGEHAEGVSFQDWFTQPLTALLKHLVQHTLTEDRDAVAIRGHIPDRFTKLIAIDSTVINLQRDVLDVMVEVTVKRRPVIVSTSKPTFHSGSSRKPAPAPGREAPWLMMIGAGCCRWSWSIARSAAARDDGASSG